MESSELNRKTNDYFAVGVIVFVVVVANVVLLCIAGADRNASATAIAIAFFVGPVINCVIAIFGLLVCMLRWSSTMTVGRTMTLFLAALLPMAAMVVDFFIIMAMGGHGG
jgi:hypothetical protein